MECSGTRRTTGFVSVSLPIRRQTNPPRKRTKGRKGFEKWVRAISRVLPTCASVLYTQEPLYCSEPSSRALLEASSQCHLTRVHRIEHISTTDRPADQGTKYFVTVPFASCGGECWIRESRDLVNHNVNISSPLFNENLRRGDSGRGWSLEKSSWGTTWVVYENFVVILITNFGFCVIWVFSSFGLERWNHLLTSGELAVFCTWMFVYSAIGRFAWRDRFCRRWCGFSWQQQNEATRVVWEGMLATNGTGVSPVLFFAVWGVSYFFMILKVGLFGLDRDSKWSSSLYVYLIFISFLLQFLKKI